MGVTPTHEGKVAVVTGSSRGIGRAIAVRLAEAGAAVVLNGRGSGELHEVADEISARGGRVATVVGSVTEPDTAPALVDAALTRFGRIDHVVNNVGISPYYGPLLGATESAVNRTLASNTWPAIRLLQCAVEAGLGLDGGSVVNISTIGSQQVQPLAGLYTAGKAALDVLTKVLARELAPRGIRVNGVAPGLVRSRTSLVLWEGDRGAAEERLVPLGRLGTPEDVASAVAFLLSAEASWITGTTLVVDGGRLLVGDEPAHLIGSPPESPTPHDA